MLLDQEGAWHFGRGARASRRLSVSLRAGAAVPGGAAQAHAVSLRAHRCRSGSLRRCRPRAAHPLPLVQWQCRAALKSAVNTHESGAGGKGFPLLQSLRDVLKHFSKEAVFLGGLWGCWLWDPIPLGGFGSGFSSSRWRQL